MDREGARPRVTAICRTDWPGVAAVREKHFLNGEEPMISFFLDMLSEPIVFTQSQLEFHQALSVAGAIRRTPFINNVPIIMYLGDPYPEPGTHRIDLAAFIEGFCCLLNNTALLRNQLQSMLQLPSRVVRTAFFFSHDTVTFPLRHFFIERFFAENSPERDAWLLPGLAYAQTPEMVDLAFMDAVVRESSPIALSEQSKNRLRLTLESGDYATFDTTNGAIQRTMEVTSARCIMAIYSYFVHRIVSMPDRTLNLYDTITTAQRYFELMFCMLMGYDLSDVIPLVASVPYNVLMVVSSVAEEVRSFLQNPSTGGNALIRSVYQRTMWFDRVYQANQQVRNMIVMHPEARRELTLFYVPCYEVETCEMVASLCQQHQVLQVRKLAKFFERLSSGDRTSPYRLENMLPRAHDPKMRDLVNQQLYACNFGGGVHLHRVMWTIAHYATMVPMFGSLREETFVGLDAANRVYMVMPRVRMEQLRLVMFADAATMRNYRKPTAVYPLLLRLYMSTRSAGMQTDLSMDRLALMTVGSVLGYWLCIPPIPNAPLCREGMPRLGQHPGTLMVIHDLVALIYRQAVLREAPAVAERPQDYSLVGNMNAMNAIRSFLLSNTVHHMSAQNVRRVRDAVAADPEHKSLLQVLDVWLCLGTNKPLRREHNGRRGRPTKQLPIENHRLRSDVFISAEARRMLARKDASHLFVSCPDATCISIFNLWMYQTLLFSPAFGEDDALRDELVRDFVALVSPLDDNFWRNKYTNYSPEIVNTWALASDYLCHAPPSQYCHNNHQLRPECADANTMFYFILFLQQFERLVCLPTSNRPSSSSPMHQADVALIRWLGELYGNQERLMRTMPVSAYYDNGDQRHHAAAFEGSMAIAEVMPSIAAQTAPVSQTPTLCVHDYRSTQLSQTAIDLAMAFGREFKEDEAKDAALCGRVHAQIAQYLQSEKAPK